MESIFSAFSEKANLLWGGILTTLTALLGDKWYLFGFFLFLNIIDLVYGWLKGWQNGGISSAKGARGVLKKVSYWVVVALAFTAAGILQSLGGELGIDLGFLRLLGWFTLAVYILNELTSIVENLILLGVSVPDILVRGLQVAHKIVDDTGDKTIPPQEK